MAYYLAAGDGASGDYVELGADIVLGSGDISIIIDAAITDPAQNWRPIGVLGSTNSRIVKFGGSNDLVLNNSAGQTVTLNASGTTFTDRNTYEFRRVGGVWSGWVNGVSASVSGSIATGFTFRTIFTYSTSGFSRGPSDLYRLQISEGGSLIHDYDPSASSGTGSTLPDTVGSNDGTLVNFPTDDSQWVFYSTGQTVSVGLVTETNSTFALGKVKAKALGLSSTADTALTLSTAIVQAVGLASETNATFDLSSTKSKAVGLNTETNAALSTTAAKALSTGLASEANATFALAARKAKSTGLASETNTAFGLTIAKALSVGLTSETDTAFSVTAITPGGATVGQAAETNTALSTTSAKGKAVGIASDTGTALTATAAKTVTVGQASTLDSAAQLAILKSLSVGLAQTTDTAIPLSIAQVVEVGLASETNTALALSVGFPLASWVYTVPVEQRIISVSAEQRSYTVPVEQRVIEVST